jgi:membrane-associated phospholipid phosphatase
MEKSGTMMAMELVIKLLADGLMVPIVLLAGYVLVFRVDNRRRYDIYTRVLMAGITSYLIAKLVGALWQPETLRPFEKLGIEAGAAYLNNPGFPSDHLLFATFLTLAVWYATRHRMITSVMLVMTILVAVGRVAAHVHTVLDVSGGVIFALIGGLWYIGFRKGIFQPFLAKSSRK